MKNMGDDYVIKTISHLILQSLKPPLLFSVILTLSQTFMFFRSKGNTFSTSIHILNQEENFTIKVNVYLVTLDNYLLYFFSIQIAV